MDAIKIALSIILLIGFSLSTDAQFTSSKLKEKADQYFENEKYYEALDLYKKYNRIKSKDPDAKLRTAICHYFTNDISSAINYLTALVSSGKKVSPVVYFYLGCSYHSQHNFKTAIQNYKLFLKNAGIDNPNRASVKDEIKRCSNGLKIRWQEKLAVVENMGEKINTRFDEFAPVQSPNYEGKMYFAAARRGNYGGLRNEKGIIDELKGTYSSDIFSATIHNGEWTDPQRMDNLINSPHNDIALDFNSTGTAMLIFKGFDLFSGQILIDSFKPRSEKPLYPPVFEGPIKAQNGDGSPFFFNDSIIIFSSRIQGGFGGSDLYLTRFSQGKWSAPQNLGPTINSSYDETSPFLAADGRTLFFSSNKVDGIGGFDIYQTKYQDFKKEWSMPTNMGLPINSPKDDEFFRLNKDGTKGFFSSSRVEGFGKRDLYIAYFKVQRMEQLVASNPGGFYNIAFPSLFKKNISDDGFEISENYFQGELADVEVSPIYYTDDDDILSNKNIAELNRIINLLKEYPQIKIELTGNSDFTDPEQFALYFSIKRAEKVAAYFIQNGVNSSQIYIKGCGSNFPLTLNGFGGPVTKKTTNLNKRIDIKLHNEQRAPINVIVNSPKVPEEQAAPKGIFYQRATKGLSYKVQVASIKQNYNSSTITDFSDAMVEKLPDSDYYKFTVGLYQTFNSAEYLRKELIRQGITVAQVVPYIDGIRADEDDFTRHSDAYPDLLNYIDSQN